MAKINTVLQQAKSGSLDEGIFNSLLKDIKVNNKNLKELIQDAAIQSILWAYVHKDYDKASKLALVVREDLSRSQFTQLKDWFLAFGPFAWRKTEDPNYESLGGFKFRKSNSKDANDFDLDGASKTLWYTLKNEESEETETKTLFPSAFMRRIDRLIGDIDKAIRQHLLDNPKVTEGQMQELLNGLNTLRTEFDYLSGETAEPKETKEPIKGSMHTARNRVPAQRGAH